MTIRDLISQFEIQGAYRVAKYDDKMEKTIVLAKGYEIAYAGVKDKYLDAKITYMYSEDNELVFEIEF